MRRVVKQQQRVKTSPAVVARRLEGAFRTPTGSLPEVDAPGELGTLVGAIQAETDKIDNGLEAAGCWVDLDALERPQQAESPAPAARPAGPPPEKEVIDLWLAPQVASAELRALASRELSVEDLCASLPDEEPKRAKPPVQPESPAASFDAFVRELGDSEPRPVAAKLDTNLSRQGVFSMLHDLASIRVAQEENLGDIRWLQPKNAGDWKLTTLGDADEAAEEYIDLWNDQRPLRRALGA